MFEVSERLKNVKVSASAAMTRKVRELRADLAEAKRDLRRDMEEARREMRAIPAPPAPPAAPAEPSSRRW